MVPKQLTDEQTQRRVTTSQDLSERQDYITGDEIWVYQYDPEMKWHSAQCKIASSP